MSRIAAPYAGLRDNNTFDRNEYGRGLPMAFAKPPVTPGGGAGAPLMPTQGGARPSQQEVADDAFKNENSANQRANAGRSKAVAGTMAAFDPSKASVADRAEIKKRMGGVDAGEEYERRKTDLAGAQNDLNEHARKYGYSSGAVIRRAMGDQNAGNPDDPNFQAEVEKAQAHMQSDKAFGNWSKIHSNAEDKASAEFNAVAKRAQGAAQSDSTTPGQALKGQTYVKAPEAGTQRYDGTPQMPNTPGQENAASDSAFDPGKSSRAAAIYRGMVADKTRQGYDASAEGQGYQAQVTQARDAQIAGTTVRGLQEQRTNDARAGQTFADESQQRQAQAAQGFAAANAPIVSKDDMGGTTVTPRPAVAAAAPLMPGTAGPGSMPGGPNYAAAPAAPPQAVPPPAAQAAQPVPATQPAAAAAPAAPAQPGLLRRGFSALASLVPGVGPAASAMAGSNMTAGASVGAPGLIPPPAAAPAAAASPAPSAAPAPQASAAPAAPAQPQTQSVGGVTLTRQPDGTWHGSNGKRYTQSNGKWQMLG